MPDSMKPDLEKLIVEALGNDEVPKLYANGFGLGLSNSDIFIVFQRFGSHPVGIVNLSYTLAKTLAQRLGVLVSEFESSIGGQPILTTDRIDEAVKKQRAAGGSPGVPEDGNGGSDDVH